MKVSAVILAGGSSERFGKDKGVVKLAGKPLIKHVFERIPKNVNEFVVVVKSEGQRKAFLPIIGDKSKLIIDEYEVSCPLAGALTGFKHVDGNYVLLLPCDTPFVSTEVLSLLIEICSGKNAVIPRWPNGYIEPLQAVYFREAASKAADEALRLKKFDFRFMISILRGIRYVSTLVLRQIDPELLTFFNVNTPMDLKRAELILKKRG